MAGHSIFGIYTTRQGVEAAVEALRDADFRSSDISVLAPENLGDIRDMGTVRSSKAPEGAATGGTSGALVGGVLGWLVGIGALVIPGLGPFLAAGPIIAALAGVGVGAAIGGVAGALVGFGVPEYEAKRYETRLGKGGILLSVHADNSDWISRAKAILEKTGAEDISSTSESRAA
ncbi:MAG: quinol:electron acceptor oxidoreductase subunit ActD [Acidobacteriaceae bacterium]